MPSSSPDKLGRYEILRELGKGSMGIVYLARDPLIGRRVALKTFRLGLGTDDEELAQFRARFIREAQSCGILNHPHIVTIHDVVDLTDDGMTFMAMEYVEGTDLKQLMRRSEPLSTALVLDIVCQVAEALDYAHQHGVVHRDVKPANVILTEQNQAKITDFGIARLNTSNLTQDGQMLGTPNYMAPEQVQGREVDSRADIFSLGVMLYEMLTRKKPFQGDNLTVVTHRIVYDDFTPPETYVRNLAPGLRRVLDRAMAKEPERRYQRARDLAEDLRMVGRRLGQGQPEKKEPAKAEPAARAEPFEIPELPVVPAPVEEPPEEVTSAQDLNDTQDLSSSRTGKPVRVEELEAGDHTLAAPLAGASMPTAAAVAASPPPTDGVTAPPATAAGASNRNLKRMAAAAAVLVAVGLAALVAVLWLAHHQRTAAAARLSEARSEEREKWAAGLEQMLAHGSRMLEGGDAEGAIETFRQAEQWVAQRRSDVESRREEASQAGDDRLAAEWDEDLQNLVEREADSSRLRQQAEWHLEEGRLAEVSALTVEEELQRARQAVRGGRYGEALAAALAVLEQDPTHEEARQIADLAEPNLNRGRRREPLPLPPAGPLPETEPVEVAETPNEASDTPGASSEEANLAIEVDSEVSRGVVMVYLGEEQLWRESFRFTEKSDGVFRRSRPTGGQLSQQLKVPAGTGTLSIFVAARDRPSKNREMSANFPAGSRRVLSIRIDAEGEITVSLR